MPTASTRIEIRFAAEAKARLERAAELSGETVSAFARAAIEHESTRVLREHESVTYVDNAYFEELLGMLDSTPKPSPKLVEAFREAQKLIPSG